MRRTLATARAHGERSAATVVHEHWGTLSDADEEMLPQLRRIKWFEKAFQGFTDAEVLGRARARGRLPAGARALLRAQARSKESASRGRRARGGGASAARGARAN